MTHRARKAIHPAIESLEQRAYFSALTFSGPTMFQAVVAPNSVRVADFNGDGRLDLIVGSDSAHQLALLLGNGDGTFQPPQAIPMSFAPRVYLAPDVNHDGSADLLVADSNASNPTLQLMLGRGDGTFQQPIDTGLPAGALAAGDFNGDGTLDLATVTGTGAVHWASGNGAGTFTVQPDVPLAENALSIVPTPLSGEAMRDVLVVTPRSTVVLNLAGPGVPRTIHVPWAADNVASIAYQQPAETIGSTSLTVPPAEHETDQIALAPTGAHGDVISLPPGDGNVWVAPTAGNGGIGAFRDSGFAGRAPREAGVFSAAGHFGGGALPDLVYADPQQGILKVLPRVGEFQFGTPITLATGVNPSAINIGDFSGHGRDDIVVADAAGNSIRIYLSGGTGIGSALSAGLNGNLPSMIVAGAAVKGIKESVTLLNSGALNLRTTARVKLLLSASPNGGTAQDQVVTNLSRKLRLGPGRSLVVPVAIRRLPVAVSGTYYLVAQVTDASGAVVSAASSPISVAAPFIDLSGTFASVPPAAKTGKPVTLFITVTNHGNVSAVGSLAIALTTGTGDPVLARLSPRRINVKPGATSALRVVTILSASGSNVLNATLDPQNLFHDASRGNNTFSSSAIQVG